MRFAGAAVIALAGNATVENDYGANHWIGAGTSFGLSGEFHRPAYELFG